MQGKQMKIELLNNEFHTNMVETVFFPFASAFIISFQFYIENANGRKIYCSTVNLICLREIIGWKEMHAKIWLIIKS